MQTPVWYRGRSDERGERPGRPPWSSRRMRARASRPRRVRKRRDRLSTDGVRQTRRAGSLFLSVLQTCSPFPRPATASADVRRPTRLGRELTPFPSREAVGAQSPIPALTLFLDLIPVLLLSLSCPFSLCFLLLRNVLSARATTPPLDADARMAMFAMHSGHMSQAFPFLPAALFVFSK